VNALLDSAASVVAGFLNRQGFALAGPVTASFQTAPNGSSGVGITVRLEDPSKAAAAEAAIHEHLGGCDVDDVRVS
jgi:hypothetical protein